MIEKVHFGKPQLKKIKEEGFFLADMHFHSKYSDTYTRPRSIVKRAAKLGIGVAITDHNHIGGYVEAAKEKNSNVPLIPGIEISTKQGPHLLAYFYTFKDMEQFYEKHLKDKKGKNPYMATRMKAEEVVELCKDYNGIVSAAHPKAMTLWDVQRKIAAGKIDDSIMKGLDCAEVLCGLILRKMNLRALSWAEEKTLGITGGSDGHTLIKLGSVVTYAKADNVGSFLDSLRKKKSYVSGIETRMLPRALSYSKAITKHSRYVGPSVMIHYKLGLRDGFNNIKDKLSSRRQRLKIRK
ncbi:PHP domain-containing protein [Candidatus Woesearchaeota archaeon]|nr:PHP domain-containing protein [Candidatus Woesearchaeota archaeon]